MRIITKVLQHMPRKVPETKEEMDALLTRLHNSFDIADDPRNWMVVLGQLSSLKPTSIRKSDRDLVVAVRRYLALGIIQEAKSVQTLKLQDMIKDKIDIINREIANGDLPPGTPDTQGELPLMSGNQDDVV